MKVLIIEDVDLKCEEVSAVLKSTVDKPEIHRAKSFRTGVQRLEEIAFDLLILDMVLPIRDGESPVEYGGKNVLGEISDGTACRTPSHIICLTAFDHVAEGFKDEARRKLVHVVLYSETESSWRQILAEKAKFIEKRIHDANRFPNSFGIDVAIVTSSPQVELQEVVKLPGFQGEFHQKDVLHYYSSMWVNATGRELAIVACAAPAMGMTAASITACKVINRWRPRFLIMTGIAAGTKTEQQFGDILIAEAAYDYGSGKITEAENGERLFIPSYCQIHIDPGLSALLQRWEREQLETDTIRRAWHAPKLNAPRIILGLLASGAAVVQSKDLVDEILDQSRKVVGLEMEAYGIMHAAFLASAPSPKAIVVKSVSDFADKRKDDASQQYAAFTSAQFVYQFFTKESELRFKD